MSALHTALQLSRFVRRQLAAHPSWQQELTAAASELHDPVPALTQRLEHCAGGAWRDEEHVRQALRQLRNFWICLVIVEDLAGHVDLQQVMAAMTALADLSIATSVAWLTQQLSARHGVPIGAESGRPQALLVVAMGKLGAAELNVSSDVDLIFLFGENGQTAPDGAQRGLSNEEFFTRLARRVIGVLADVTADGFVFRVDMRLRPNGDAGPIACSLAMLEEYLVVQGRTWERLAWIKARVVATGPSDTGPALASLIRPFVYRRYLDFSAIAALRELHAEIRAQAARRDARHPQRAGNIKLGRGGIREIEFIAQHLQLIRGGRDPGLQVRSTLAVLSGLSARGLLKHSVARQLQKTYVLLREIEHRLQYRDDAQTHVLPQAADELAALVAMCQSWPDAPLDAAALLHRLGREQDFVATQFDALFRTGTQPATTPREAPLAGIWSALRFETEARSDALNALRAAGFVDADAAYGQLHALWHSARMRSLSASAKDRLERLVPQALRLALQYARAECDASVLLARLFALIEAIAGRASYLALLYEYPEAFARVAELLAASPWAARFLTQHPLLLDELLQRPDATVDPVPSEADGLAAQLAAARGDVERQMDVLREGFHAESFALLVQDLAGHLSVETLADRLSALSDQIIALALEQVWRQLAPEVSEGPDFAVIAYGKLGGKELGYASDLDLVFLSGVSSSSESLVRYGRLAQRLISWLTARTSAGGLFDIDVRLRPDGVAGLTVATMDSFTHYQEQTAWVWEHQALTRARFVAGHAALQQRFDALRRQILMRVRDVQQLKAEIRAMRQRMHEGHPNHSALFDLKHDAGGMVDIEFAVQFLVLGHAARYPQLVDNVGNIALLQRAADVGLIDAPTAKACAAAYRDFRRAQHQLRLAEARYARVPTSEFVAQRAAVEALFRTLLD